MPDVHAGAGCTVGTTMTITDKVVPNLVGVDIGCGMETVRLREDHMEMQRLDKVIRDYLDHITLADLIGQAEPGDDYVI